MQWQGWHLLCMSKICFAMLWVTLMGRGSVWYHAANCEVSLQPGLVILEEKEETKVKIVLHSFLSWLQCPMLCSVLMRFRWLSCSLLVLLIMKLYTKWQGTYSQRIRSEAHTEIKPNVLNCSLMNNIPQSSLLFPTPSFSCMQTASSYLGQFV